MSRSSQIATTEAPAEAEADTDQPQPVEYAERGDGGKSWTLEHVSEVVYLATEVQMTQQITEAIAYFEAGDRLALEVHFCISCDLIFC